MKRQALLLPFIVSSLALSSTPVLADAWVLHAPVWCRSYGEASVPGQNVIDDSGVDIPQCSSDTGVLINPPAQAQAIASSRGLWGGTVGTTGVGGGTAGLDNPFVASIDPVLGLTGIAELDYDVTRNNNILNISGTSEYNANGFFELAVLDLTGLSLTEQQQFTSNLFLTFGSIEKALDAGAISSSQVLFRERETEFLTNGSFTFTVDVDSLADNDIVVTSLAHAVSAAVPEPFTFLGTATALGFGTFFKRKLKLGKETIKVD